ncbi:STAS domain-containing protein [Burkholderiaceae bacterium FT117]|uniref:STAS domain-containing protein n=1 Tax=Zeimonas sediminis TaxID=2944268 RepID=UPI002343067C|nr:STAS domain-containing protein [Zeimonas sediminis]MCM5571666.1 STAS domain-containing protein [Zeimonas sediminis]
MVFSIFSRKDKSPSRRDKPDAARAPDGAAAPAGGRQSAPDTLAARREAARLTAEKIDRIESEMIADGSRPAPASTMRLRADTVPAAVVAPPSRPVTDLLQGSTSLALGDPSMAMAIDINASSLPGALEEGAILYANGQPDAAAAALKQALSEFDLGGYQQLGWLMLLDLHQLSGDKAAFESLALDYAARFESSPPAWTESEDPAADARQPAGSVVALPANLDASVGGRVDLIVRGMDRRRETVIDCGPLQSADAAGAARLMALFGQVGKVPASRHQLVVRGAQRLFDVARAAIEPGRRDDSDACWMLALFALRLLGDQQAFEDLGIEYCVTFEVSPPSWEPLPASIRNASAAGAAAAPGAAQAAGSPPAEPNAFVLSGEVTGRAAAEIRALRAFATGRADVVIDCRKLRRLEFVAVGELLNEIVNLRSAGKQVLFAEPNRLVYALMLVMGLQELAEIRKRRI